MPELLTSVLLSFTLAAAAQQPAPRSRLRPVTTPVREVSVRVDPDTGVARRSPSSLGPGAALPVYDNTCQWYGVTYFYDGLDPAQATGGSRAQALIAQGRIPSTASPETQMCATGLADTYSIRQLQIAYCTTTGAPVSYVTHFWNNAGGACPDDFGLPTAFDLTVHGLPRSAGAGVLSCYVVNIDVGAPGFTLVGGASNTAAQRFAYSIEFPQTTGSDGPIVAGSPTFPPYGCWPCAGTIWERPAATSELGTGLGNTGSWWLEEFGGTLTGCYFFGAWASFHLELDADLGASTPGQPFCDGSDGAHASCPCGASNPASGCNHTQGYGAHAAAVAQDVAQQTATIQGSLYPSGPPTTVLIRGNSREPTPVPFGDGLRCVGLAGLVRLGATVASGGISIHAISHGAGPGSFHYQIWFRNTPTSYCVTTGPSLGAFNLSNGQTLTW